MNRFGKADVCNGIVQRNVGRDNVFKEYIVFCCTIVSFLLANIRYYAGSGGGVDEELMQGTSELLWV